MCPVGPNQNNERHLLSPAQRRMWTIQLLKPQNNAYNMTTAVRLSGSLDPDLVREAIEWRIENGIAEAVKSFNPNYMDFAERKKTGEYPSGYYFNFLKYIKNVCLSL